MTMNSVLSGSDGAVVVPLQRPELREQGRRRLLSSHHCPRHLPLGSTFPKYFISLYHFIIIYQYFEPWRASSGLETWIIWETLERTLAVMWKTQQVMVEVRVCAGSLLNSSQRGHVTHSGWGTGIMEWVTSGFAGYQALKKSLRDLPMHWIWGVREVKREAPGTLCWAAGGWVVLHWNEETEAGAGMRKEEEDAPLDVLHLRCLLPTPEEEAGLQGNRDIQAGATTLRPLQRPHLKPQSPVISIWGKTQKREVWGLSLMQLTSLPPHQK